MPPEVAGSLLAAHLSMTPSRRKGLPHLCCIFMAALVGTLTPLAAAGNLIDSASVGMRVRVLQAIQVDALSFEIDLGDVPQGTSLQRDAAVPDIDWLALFSIQGSSSFSWRLAVEYSSLTGPNGSTVHLGPPLGEAICFINGDDVQGDCAVSGGESVVLKGHDGRGTARVGYSATIPPDASEGLYSNPQAIVLTAEVLLGSE